MADGRGRDFFVCLNSEPPFVLFFLILIFICFNSASLWITKLKEHLRGYSYNSSKACRGPLTRSAGTHAQSCSLLCAGPCQAWNLLPGLRLQPQAGHLSTEARA